MSFAWRSGEDRESNEHGDDTTELVVSPVNSRLGVRLTPQRANAIT